MVQAVFLLNFFNRLMRRPGIAALFLSLPRAASLFLGCPDLRLDVLLVRIIAPPFFFFFSRCARPLVQLPRTL